MHSIESRSRLLRLASALGVLLAFEPRDVLALQQRIMVADYGFSLADIQRVFATVPPGSLILTGTAINQTTAEPPFDMNEYNRLKAYHDFGYIVLGYVSTFNGNCYQMPDTCNEGPPNYVCRTENCINQFVDQYMRQYGPGQQRGSAVDGIMFDLGGGLADNPDRAPFYRNIYNHVKADFGLFSTVFLNVAAPLQESQGAGPLDVVFATPVADIFQLYEVPCAQYLDSYENPHWPTWWANVPPERQAELPSLCTTRDQVVQAVAKSKLYGVGWFYAFDGSADPPGGYGHLPPADLWDVEYPMILDSSAPRSVAELTQRFCCGDNLFENIVWTVTQLRASVAVLGGYLKLAPDPCTSQCVGNQARVTSRLAWNLTNSSASVQVRKVVNNGNVNNKFTILRGPGDYNNSLHWWYENQSLVAKYYVSGVEHVVGSISPYDPMVNDAWLRIHESAGILYWETSATGLASSWVVRGSAQTADVFPVNSIYVVLDAQTFGDGSSSPGEAQYSNLNVVPP